MKRIVRSGGRPCPTRKRRYKDHASAARALRNFQRSSNREKVQVRCYECNLCLGWHLTSREEA